MIGYHTDTKSSSARKKISRHSSFKKITPEQAAKSVKDAANRIREISSSTRKAVKTFHESGAIPEMVEAVHDAAITARDSTKDICDTAKEVKDSHIIEDTAKAVEQTAAAANETLQATTQDRSKQLQRGAPKTSRAVVAKETKQSLNKKAAKPQLIKQRE